MFVLFMKKLVVDTSAEEIRRVTNILEQNNLKYVVRTARTRGNIGTFLDARTYASANLAMYKGASQPSFIYSVYIRSKEHDFARELIKES